jgi:hypothetical protein
MIFVSPCMEHKMKHYLIITIYTRMIIPFNLILCAHEFIKILQYLIISRMHIDHARFIFMDR